MMIAMLILAALGAGMIIYALVGVFSAPNEVLPKKSNQKPTLSEASGKEQKTQWLQKQVAALEAELSQAKIGCEKEKSEFLAAKEKEAKFSDELERREEWVAKAEVELAKIKIENLDLGNKFITKEKELQEEFSKNVEFGRQISELKTVSGNRAEEIQAQAEQIQIQKHQIEKQLKEIKEYSAAIAEFNRKEKISEWVPKAEFNQLNEEYTRLEKELEESQEKLKSFAAELVHLRAKA